MSRTLSESESKALLGGHGIPFAAERLVQDPGAAGDAAQELGLPVAAKLCGANISHKTERGLVRLGLGDRGSVEAATAELLDAARPEDDATGVLIAPMVGGSRELIAGVSVDEQFGATVLVGIGGVLTEALRDVAVRLVPIERIDALEMLEQLNTQDLLGEVRGEPPVDRDAVADVLVALSDLARSSAELLSVDLNPLIISDGRPVAVDALVELSSPGAAA